MRHLGDITRIDGGNIEPIDIITGGSPCQDLSVAGKRAGLDGERSGLFMEQIRIIKEMRENEKRNGKSGRDVRPRHMVFENVPGLLTSNGGKDFQTVLTEIVRIACKDAPDVPMPERGGWTPCGILTDVDGGWSVAWRVHDAQYYGIPQRRKRIALVADFGGGSAPEILFERKSVSGDFEPGKETRKDPSSASGESAFAAIENGLTGKHDGSPATGRGSGENVVTYGIGSYGSKAWTSGNPKSGIYEADVAKTIDLIGGGDLTATKAEPPSSPSKETDRAHPTEGTDTPNRTSNTLSTGPKYTEYVHAPLKQRERGNRNLVFGGLQRPEQSVDRGEETDSQASGFNGGAGVSARGLGYAKESCPTIRSGHGLAVPCVMK